MNARYMILSVLCLLTLLSAGAQNSREKVELLAIEGTLAVFSSEGYADNKKDALENSKMAVLRKLLYDGVEGINDGNPIATSDIDTNLWLKGFFMGKYPAYKNFTGDIELVGDFDNAPTGEVHCQSNVMIKYKLLMTQAQTNGVMTNAGGSMSQPVAPANVPQEPVSQPKKSWGKRNF